MTIDIPAQRYSGSIGITGFGPEKAKIEIGGETAYPFHIFEGNMPKLPKIAMEIWDYDPSNEWPEAAKAPFKNVLSSPSEWAKKCVKDYGADVIVLQLKSIDPNGMNRDAEEAALVAKSVVDAVDVPVITWGTANNKKDEEVLKKIAEICQNSVLALGPVEAGNYKGVGAAAMGYGHVVIASSPIDVNLAKQLNILLSNLGIPSHQILIDPTTGGLGYGLEYCYSVMERIRMAALTQNDDKLQIPIINNVGNEVWKTKEAGLSSEAAPAFGDSERRAVLMEVCTAVIFLMAGSDIVIMRHPESVRLVRSYISLMTDGGSASGIEGIKKQLAEAKIDLTSISPAPDLDFGAKDKVNAVKGLSKEVDAPKAEIKKTEIPPENKKDSSVIDVPGKGDTDKEQIEAKKEAETAAEMEAERREKEEKEARLKAEEETKKAEDAAKAEAERKKEETRLQAEKEKAKRAAARKEQDDLELIKTNRAAHMAASGVHILNPASVLLTVVGGEHLIDTIIAKLDRIHRRVK